MKFKTFFSIALTALLIAFVFVVDGYSFIELNGVGGGYGGGGGEAATLQSVGNETIEYYIMEGGGYYLEANTHIQALLKMVERQDIQGIYYFEMIVTADNARYCLQKAIESYEKLISLAEATPYNSTVQEKLRVFDYDTFAKTMGLSKEYIDMVRGYLQCGNITGALKKTHGDFLAMLDLVNKARISFYQFRLPQLSLFWQLNEKQAGSALFGSYTTRILYAIDR